MAGKTIMTPQQFIDYVGDPKVAKNFATEVVKLVDENHSEPAEEKPAKKEDKEAKKPK